MTTLPQAYPDTAESVGLDHAALQRLDDRIEKDVRTGRYLGASIIVARGGVIGHRATIGEVAPGRSGADDDVYVLMSLSKAFTAALVLRAIDQGRFGLDTRASEILPEFGARGKQRATVYHLLTHTAGTYAGFAPPPPLSMAHDIGALAKNVQVISALPAANAPGDRVVYNPFASYAVLGQILVATDPAGRSFQQIAREDLFEPLGMHDTSYGLAVDDHRRVPVSTPATAGAVTDGAVMEMLNHVFDETSEHPAGGAFGTADDVLRFAEALRRRGATEEYRLMSPATFDYARRNHTGDRSNGFWDFDREARDIPLFPANFTLLGGYVRGEGHHITPFGFTASPATFGAVGGGSTMLMVDPERDLTFVYLSAGFLEGLDHFKRLQTLADLALSAVND
jgi:CubicO group peptidase (beta-lactamase class C family)